MSQPDRRAANRPSKWAITWKFGVPALCAGLGGFAIGQNNPPPSALPAPVTVQVDRVVVPKIHIVNRLTENK